jgi:long-subunit acyl-CoA synthetase (AMP-forming)
VRCWPRCRFAQKKPAIRAARGGGPGGGALPPHVDEPAAVGITLLEGYGSTETSPKAARTFDRLVLGRGLPIRAPKSAS